MTPFNKVTSFPTLAFQSKKNKENLMILENIPQREFFESIDLKPRVSLFIFKLMY